MSSNVVLWNEFKCSGMSTNVLDWVQMLWDWAQMLSNEFKCSGMSSNVVEWGQM